MRPVPEYRHIHFRDAIVGTDLQLPKLGLNLRISTMAGSTRESLLVVK
jgi:hypothetical protein